MKTFEISLGAIVTTLLIGTLGAVGFPVLFIGTYGACFLAGNFADVMFMKNVVDINPIARPLVGLLYNWHFSEGIRMSVDYFAAFLGALLLATVVSVIVTPIQSIVCRMCYGIPAKGSFRRFLARNFWFSAGLTAVCSLSLSHTLENEFVVLVPYAIVLGVLAYSQHRANMLATVEYEKVLS